MKHWTSFPEHRQQGGVPGTVPRFLGCCCKGGTSPSPSEGWCAKGSSLPWATSGQFNWWQYLGIASGAIPPSHPQWPAGWAPSAVARVSGGRWCFSCRWCSRLLEACVGSPDVWVDSLLSCCEARSCYADHLALLCWHRAPLLANGCSTDGWQEQHINRNAEQPDDHSVQPRQWYLPNLQANARHEESSASCCFCFAGRRWTWLLCSLLKLDSLLLFPIFLGISQPVLGLVWQVTVEFLLFTSEAMCKTSTCSLLL